MAKGNLSFTPCWISKSGCVWEMKKRVIVLETVFQCILCECTFMLVCVRVKCFSVCVYVCVCVSKCLFMSYLGCAMMQLLSCCIIVNRQNIQNAKCSSQWHSLFGVQRGVCVRTWDRKSSCALSINSPCGYWWMGNPRVTHTPEPKGYWWMNEF